MQYAKRFLNRDAFMQVVKKVKENYCPDGELCEVIIMFTVCFGTMWLAMLPLF